MSLPLAHGTWFTDSAGDNDWSFLFEGTTLALLAAALAVTVAVRVLNHLRDGVDVGWLAAMAPYMPFAVRTHLAVSLVGLLSLGFYLSPAWICRRTWRGSCSARSWSSLPSAWLRGIRRAPQRGC